MAPTQGSEKLPTMVRYGLISGASFWAETVTFPIDFAKTRMQLHVGRKGFFSVLMAGVREEGLGAVYAALPPAVLRHVVYTSIRISLYEDLRHNIREHLPLGPFGAKALAGITAGGVAQAAASPCDRLKVVLMKEGGKRSMAQVARDIIRKEGYMGMYVGVGPNVLRAALVNLGELTTYDSAKQKILKVSGLPDGLVVHTCSAVCSGLVASICATPADVVKSRVMGGQATGIVSCVRDTVRNEGLVAMWKGFFPNWARLGPWQLTFWVTYEHLRQACGYGGF